MDCLKLRNLFDLKKNFMCAGDLFAVLLSCVSEEMRKWWWGLVTDEMQSIHMHRHTHTHVHTC